MRKIGAVKEHMVGVTRHLRLSTTWAYTREKRDFVEDINW
jgi:hypothetical protein